MTPLTRNRNGEKKYEKKETEEVTGLGGLPQMALGNRWPGTTTSWAPQVRGRGEGEDERDKYGEEMRKWQTEEDQEEK